LAIAGCIITRIECRSRNANKLARHSCAGRNLDSVSGNLHYHQTHKNLRSILNVRDPCLRRDDGDRTIRPRLRRDDETKMPLHKTDGILPSI